MLEALAAGLRALANRFAAAARRLQPLPRLVDGAAPRSVEQPPDDWQQRVAAAPPEDWLRRLRKAPVSDSPASDRAVRDSERRAPRPAEASGADPAPPRTPPAAGGDRAGSRPRAPRLHALPAAERSAVPRADAPPEEPPPHHEQRARESDAQQPSSRSRAVRLAAPGPSSAERRAAPAADEVAPAVRALPAAAHAEPASPRRRAVATSIEEIVLPRPPVQREAPRPLRRPPAAAVSWTEVAEVASEPTTPVPGVAALPRAFAPTAPAPDAVGAAVARAPVAAVAPAPAPEPWPPLPVAPPADPDDRREASLRERERRRRLHCEQEGTPWSE